MGSILWVKKLANSKTGCDIESLNSNALRFGFQLELLALRNWILNHKNANFMYPNIKCHSCLSALRLFILSDYKVLTHEGLLLWFLSLTFTFKSATLAKVFVKSKLNLRIAN